jgi:o-succinylbenzoate synthase
LLDLRGKSEGRSLTALLGGKPSSLAVNALIAAESAKQAAAEAIEAVRLGFGSLKLKVGRGTLDNDEDLVSAVRQAVGPGVKLRLDPNQAWGTSQAIESIRRLSRYQLEYVEQPVAAADVAGLAEVRRSVPVPVAADESLGSLNDFRHLLRADAADVFVLKAARLGGMKSSLEIAKAAIKAGKSVVVTTSLESDIGVAASAHLAAAVSAHSMAHGLATGLLFDAGLTAPRLLPANGALKTPDGPGLGMKADPALLNKYAIDITGSAGSLSGLEDYVQSRRS